MKLQLGSRARTRVPTLGFALRLVGTSERLAFSPLLSPERICTPIGWHLSAFFL